jgi:hypothetical protein
MTPTRLKLGGALCLLDPRYATFPPSKAGMERRPSVTKHFGALNLPRCRPRGDPHHAHALLDFMLATEKGDVPGLIPYGSSVFKVPASFRIVYERRMESHRWEGENLLRKTD